MELFAAARRWLAHDPDPKTRAELAALLAGAPNDQVMRAELASAFAGPLTFGTAGLRGKLGPGPARMNRLVVSQAAAGLGRYLLASSDSPSVVIGKDARYNSDVFALDSAQILAGMGFSVYLFEQALPTPLLAFAIKHLGCVAGVMVTASHNPREDNGYKVYLGDGCQIVPPTDELISQQIAAVDIAEIAQLPRSSKINLVGSEVISAYLDRAASITAVASPNLQFCYTPLHGVGAAIVPQLLTRLGFTPPLLIPSQAVPDPDFPTVAFPNPEEPGALDAAIAQADAAGLDLVLANDPDADRCAVAVRGAAGWRTLSGDQIGVLLADDLLRRGARGTFAASIVSATLLARVAAAYGQPYAATLTGFKWIARVPGLRFGYEEALGYCCDPEAVADKDGITALAAVARLAAELAAQGQSLEDRLAEIERRHGVHVTDQLSVRVVDLKLISQAMTQLRARPPVQLAGEPVSLSDLQDGWEGLPPTDAVLLQGASLRVVVRPSGTEPKLKCYLETRASVNNDLAQARQQAANRCQILRTEIAAALGLNASDSSAPN